MERGLLDLMRQKIALKRWLRDSTEGYGKPVYTGVPTTYRARVVAKPETLVGRDGQQTVSVLTAWVATTTAVGLKDQFTYEGSTYPILDVTRPTDERGRVHHAKIRLGFP